MGPLFSSSRLNHRNKYKIIMVFDSRVESQNSSSKCIKKSFIQPDQDHLFMSLRVANKSLSMFFKMTQNFALISQRICAQAIFYYIHSGMNYLFQGFCYYFSLYLLFLLADLNVKVVYANVI